MYLNSLFLPQMLNVCVCVCSALLAASSTTGPESLVSERDSVQLPSKNPSSWSIEEVMQFVRDADPTALAPHAELFRKHVSKLLLKSHKFFFLLLLALATIDDLFLYMVI